MLVATPSAAAGAVAAPAPGVTTSWLGNSLPGGNPFSTATTPTVQYMQDHIQGIAVDRDGTVYTNSSWDEGNHEAGVYRNGAVVARLSPTHGPWYGDKAVAIDASYVYLGMWDTGTTWGVGRFSKSTFYPVPIPGGLTGNLSIRAISNHGSVTGLAAGPSLLYVSDATDNLIRVFDTATLRFQRSFRLAGAGPITIDGRGNLWVVSSAGVVHLTPSGGSLGPGLKGIGSPSALAMDGGGGLLVADGGYSQQVLDFDVRGSTPRLIQRIGVPHGIWNGPVPGRVGDLRFDFPTGIGVDAAGHLFVANNGDGADLRSLSRGPGKAWTMTWHMYASEFLGSAVMDPTSGDAGLYSAHARYAVDWTRPPGQNSVLTATTFDPWLYPHDARTFPGGYQPLTPSGVVVVGGHTFLVLSSQYGRTLAIYRFRPGSAIAIPSVVIANRTIPAGPANQPTGGGGWIWRDTNGNGKMDPGEFESTGSLHDSWGAQMDTAGDVWQVFDASTIDRMQFQGLDKVGNPIYSRQSHLIRYGQPAELAGGPQRLHYDAPSDTMFLAGYASKPPDGTWGAVGDTVARYDHWSSSPTLHWRASVPFRWDTQVAQRQISVTMDVAGSRLFLGEQTTAAIRMFDTATGTLLGTWGPGPEVNSYSGWIDTPDALHAWHRANEYDVFVEEDLTAKVLIYRLS